MRLRNSTGRGMSAIACLAILVSASVVSEADGVTPESDTRYHASAVRGQEIELEVQIPGVQHVAFEISGMLEKLFDHEAPFNFLIDTAGLQKGKHEWYASAYQEGCCVYGKTAGSIQIYALPKVRAPIVVPLLAAGRSRVKGLVVSKVARNLTVRAWAPRPGSGKGMTNLPLSLRHRHRSKRIYEFARGAAVSIGRHTEIAVEVAPVKRTVRHRVEVRGRLAQLRLRHNPRTGATRALQSAVTACTTARRRQGNGAQPLPKREGCAIAPATTPPVSMLCIQSMQCSPGTAPRSRRG